MTLSRRAALIASIFAATLILGASFARAQSPDIAYPVAELGNCGSKQECRAYCDDLAHITECVSFAERSGLMSAKEAQQARNFAKLGGKGPGGCDSKSACEAYCEDVTHIRECLAFAEEHDVIPEDDIEEARSVARALEAGAQLPGGCTSKKTCETYCEDPAHMRQCINFAKQAGFMSGEELAEAEKMASFLEGGGKMPGGCRGERECRAYCESGEHMEECAEFAIRAGFMSEKDAEMFRKTGGKGPGGCRGRECESYCDDETHRDECVAFALEHDLMSPEDKRRMEEGMQKGKEALEKAPPEVLSCIESALGSAEVEKIRNGQAFGQKLGEILPECFRKVMGGGENRGPFGPGSSATDCMREVFGDDFEENMRSGELDPGARDTEIRECMQSQMGEGFLNDSGEWERPERGEPGERPEGFGPPGNMGPEDMMRPDDMRFGPPEGEDRDEREAGMRGRYGGEFDAQRANMERKMRAEIETQMRSGNFDPSRLPSDFRPEGAFPPPEARNRPPEGFDTSGQPPAGSGIPGTFGPGSRPPEGMMPPGGMTPGGAMPPAGFAPPAGFTQPMTQPVPPSGEPISSRDRFLANVASVLLSLFGL